MFVKKIKNNIATIQLCIMDLLEGRNIYVCPDKSRPQVLQVCSF